MFLEYWAPVFICALASLAAALICCLPYGKNSRTAAENLEYAAGKLDKQKRCSIQNIKAVGVRVSKTGNVSLMETWERYQTDAEALFNGENVPEPSAYFTYEDIFAVPGQEKFLSVLHGILPTFAVLSLAAPLMSLLFSSVEITPGRVRACVASACAGIIFVAAVYIVSFIYIRRINQKNLAAMLHFNRTLSALLPVLNQSTQASFLLRASRQNTEAFIETAKIIARKIDNFAVRGITPVVAEAFEKSVAEHISPAIVNMERTHAQLSRDVVRQQEKGMYALAQAFAENLSGSVARQMKAMTADMEQLSVHLNGIQQNIEEIADKLYESLNADSAVLKETAEISRSVAGQHELTRQNIGEMTEALSRTELLVGRIDERDAGVFTSLSAAYERLGVMQTRLEDQLLTVNAMTEAVAEKLTDTTAAVSDSVKELIASTAEKNERAFALISEKITAAVDETNASNAETFGKISGAVQYLIEETGKAADSGFDRVWQKLSETFEQTNASNSETYSRISNSVESLASSVGVTVSEAFERYSDHLLMTMNETISSNNDTSKKLAATMDSLALAGTEQYEKAARAAAQLLENVVVEMNKAMDGVGHEIAESINQASLGSAEIVRRLAEKTEHLKEEYDKFFSRVEEQGNTNLDELEFRIQNIFSRFSNDATGVMDKLEGNISKATELFEGSTTMLLQNLEEQSRSMGLYAKDLNIDVATLSESLRESVGIFTEQLNNSTRKTFSEFDAGLAEVSARLANTVESIRESVENLPVILGTVNKNHNE